MNWVQKAGKWAGDAPEFCILSDEAIKQAQSLRAKKKESLDKIRTLRSKVREKKKEIYKAQMTKKRFKTIKDSDAFRGRQ